MVVYQKPFTYIISCIYYYSNGKELFVSWILIYNTNVQAEQLPCSACSSIAIEYIEKNLVTSGLESQVR